MPITMAAFAAYAFSCMHFCGRQLLFVLVVALMVVPLQMALIPTLRLYNGGAELFGLTVFPDLDLNGTFLGTSDRKSVVYDKGVAVGVDPGARRILKKKKDIKP